MKVENVFNIKLAAAAAKRGKLYLRLRQKGLTEEQIAQRYGISRQRVNQIINKARKIH